MLSVKVILKVIAIVLFLVGGLFSLPMFAGLFTFDFELLLGGVFLTLPPLLLGLWLWHKCSGKSRQTKVSSNALERTDDASKKSTCIRCDRKRKPWEKFTKYGLCEMCDRAGRDAISHSISTLQNVYDMFYGCDIIEFSQVHPDVKDTLLSTLTIIDNLEDMRLTFPFYKSPTEDKRVLFTDLLAQLKNITPSAISVEIEPTYFYERVYVAGCRHCSILGVEPGMDLELVADPENEHDSNAIQVICQGSCIGYVPKKVHQEMVLDFWKRGQTVEAQVDEVEDEDVYMSLAFYR